MLRINDMHRGNRGVGGGNPGRGRSYPAGGGAGGRDGSRDGGRSDREKQRVKVADNNDPVTVTPKTDKICVNDLAHQLLKSDVKKHAAGSCNFPHLVSYAAIDKGELTRQCKAVLTRNPALLARLVTAIAAM